MWTSDNLMVVQPDEGMSHGRIVQKVDAEQTGGRWGVVIVRSERGTSGWTHLHRGEPEGFFVLDGDVELCGSESVTRVGPGTFVLAPPDTEHSFRVLSEEACWLAIWPASLDGLSEELQRAQADGRNDLTSTAEIRMRHGTFPGRRIG